LDRTCVHRLIIDLKYQPKRLYKKLLTVFCLLIMSSLGFAEDGIQPSNKDNIKILQQENLIKSQQLNHERKMKVQAQKELEELKKQMKSRARKPLTINVILVILPKVPIQVKDCLINNHQKQSNINYQEKIGNLLVKK